MNVCHAALLLPTTRSLVLYTVRWGSRTHETLWYTRREVVRGGVRKGCAFCYFTVRLLLRDCGDEGQPTVSICCMCLRFLDCAKKKVRQKSYRLPISAKIVVSLLKCISALSVVSRWRHVQTLGFLRQFDPASKFPYVCGPRLRGVPAHHPPGAPRDGDPVPLAGLGELVRVGEGVHVAHLKVGVFRGVRGSGRIKKMWCRFGIFFSLISLQ